MKLFTVLLNSDEIQYAAHSIETEYRWNRAYGLPAAIWVDCIDTAYIAIL